ncbi:MAG: YbaB/EbfC family nucleoid-associated protein [Bacteroidota bacterium]
MFDKLQQAQQKSEEIKRKLDSIEVEGEAGNGLVKVVANANRKIKDVLISDTLMTLDRKEELQDLIQIAMEKAMKTADDISQSEMAALMSTMMPGGLGSLFGK